MDKEEIKEKKLAFYQTVLAEQFKMGSGMTKLLITLSVSLIAFLPQFYKGVAVELLHIVLVGYGLVVLLGLVMYRLDYKQLQTFQKQNDGADGTDFVKFTYPLLVAMLTTFVLTFSVMIYTGIQLTKKQETDNMPVKKIIIHCEERKDYSGISCPTVGGGKKPKKESQK